MRDAKLKGKFRGENAGRAKHTKKQVAEIRELYGTGKYSQHALAKKYGVSHTNIYAIVNNKIWRKV